MDTKKPLNIVAVSGFVLSLLSLLISILSYGISSVFRLDYFFLYVLSAMALTLFLPIGFILSIIGLILSKKKGQRGKKLAISGIIISSVMVVLVVFCFIVFFIILSKFRPGPYPGYHDQPRIASIAREASVEQAKQNCKMLCEGIQDDDSLIEFCRTIYAVDWNKDAIIENDAYEDRWTFCEEKIPCFVLEPDCKRKYDGNRCRETLARYRPEIYDVFRDDIEGRSPSNQAEAFQDGCGLRYYDESLPLEDQSNYNWKQRYCFNETEKVAASDDYICAQPPG